MVPIIKNMVLSFTVQSFHGKWGRALGLLSIIGKHMYVPTFRITSKHTVAIFIAVGNLMMFPLHVDTKSIGTKELPAVSLANTHLRYLRSSGNLGKTIYYKFYVSFPKKIPNKQARLPL